MTGADAKTPPVPTSEEFLRTMGQVSWLMTLSPEHRDRPIRYLEAHLAAPLMLKQVRVVTRGSQPVAALSWAYASPEVKARIEAGGHVMALGEWRSGPEIVIVEVISPLIDRQIVINQFLGQIKGLTSN